MLTKEQLQYYGQKHQVDTFTVFREYLQLVFLNSLYQEKKAEKVFFKGGTCLRLIYESPRFSEDLDFSTRLSKKTIDALLQKVVGLLQKDVPEVTLRFLWHGEKTVRYRLVYEGDAFKYPLPIRLDFSFESPFLQTEVSSLKSELPITLYSFVAHLSSEEIFTEKIRAFFTRLKGRDVFDLWYLVEKGVVFNEVYAIKKLKAVSRAYSKEVLLGKIKNYPLHTLDLDLSRFLPQHVRKIIPALQNKLLDAL
ncbi:MAG: hypothetical protein UW24_C0023G0011 [Parcubacteria group bacterium GW2011_GWA2_44_12]|nr:MAG: hypothetical protein UW24_C0023G0011 [Parcubacteria group bacterium GW2011_GWA2_44_12]